MCSFVELTWQSRHTVEAFLGEAGSVAFDPTNNLLGCERHIHVAVGRDSADVPPTAEFTKAKRKAN